MTSNKTTNEETEAEYRKDTLNYLTEVRDYLTERRQATYGRDTCLDLGTMYDIHAALSMAINIIAEEGKK